MKTNNNHNHSSRGLSSGEHSDQNGSYSSPLDMTRSSVRTNIFGFTLVELIVVITILVILGTIAFLNLGGFQSNARDSVRIENMSNLKKGLDIHHIRSGYYPLPEESISLMASGTLIGYQGFAKEQVGSIAKLSPGGTIDPLDPSITTTYSTNADATKMQAMVYLENGDSVTTLNSVPSSPFGTLSSSRLITPSPISMTWRGIGGEVHAASTSDYSNRFPSTLGDTLGILLDNGTGSTKNRPVQELASVSFTGVDVVNTNSGYVAVFGNKDIISGTGTKLIGLKASYTQKNDPMIYDPSLVGYWDMETTASNGKLADLSGNGNHGTMGGGITIGGVIGKVGKAMSFNGSNSTVYFSKNNFSGVNGTIVAWVNPKLLNNTLTTIFDISHTSNNGGIIFATNNSGAINFQYGNGLTLSGCTNNITSLSLDIYQHMVVIYGTFGSKIYINGVLLLSNSFIPNIDMSATTYSHIGSNGGWGRFFKGSIDEVRIYNRALSDSEIKALYSATK